jgi:hypothetical protein
VRGVEGAQERRRARAGAAAPGRRRAAQRDHRAHVVGDAVVEAADEAAVVRQPDHGREEALRDAERHVDAPRVAPLGHHVAAAQDHAGGRAALGERAERLAVRLAPEGAEVRLLEVARRLALAGDREGDGLGEPGGVEPHPGGGAALPVLAGPGVVGGVDGGARRAGGGLGPDGGRGRREQDGERGGEVRGAARGRAGDGRHGTSRQSGRMRAAS